MIPQVAGESVRIGEARALQFADPGVRNVHEHVVGYMLGGSTWHLLKRPRERQGQVFAVAVRRIATARLVGFGLRRVGSAGREYRLG